MFLARLKGQILKNDLFKAGDQILVGVSGGVDSLALLDSLYRLSHEEGWKIWAAHLDHQFRGEESEEDAEFVKQFCNARQIPCEIGSRDVPKFIRESGRSPQDAARYLRYLFFQEVCEKWNLNKLALAHHANDQAETVLMRVFRGTGIEGLAGIPQIRDQNGVLIIRPFLSFYKSELVDYCREHGIEHREDSSNAKITYKRNLLRLKVIPWIEQQLGHEIQDSLVHLADIAAEENAFLEELTREKAKKIINEETNNKIVIKGKLFLDCPLALQRRMIKLIFNYLLKKEENPAFIHIHQICEWIRTGQSGTQLTLPFDIRAWKEYDDIVFTEGEAETETKPYLYSLKIPGRTYIKEIDCWITTKITDSLDGFKEEAGWQAHFDVAKIHGTISIRTRRNGDRMTILGMPGRKKVKDILIDAKVPRRKRDVIPIVTDEANILWIPGVKRSNVAIETSATRQFLSIHIEDIVDK